MAVTIYKQRDLYYQAGSSDKEYHLYILQDNSKYSLKIEYGRRGSSLTTDIKVSNQPLWLCEREFDKKVKEKVTKGYTDGAGKKPFTQTTLHKKPAAVAAWSPQLLCTIESHEVSKYIEDLDWIMQEKKDGKRIILERITNIVQAVNRRGIYVDAPAEVEAALATYKGDIVIDGELVGSDYWVFDFLQFNANKLTEAPYEQRYSLVKALFGIGSQSHILIVPTAITVEEKWALFDDCEKRGVEGIVFKKRTAPYRPGRPNSYGDQLKYKFYSTATCIVSGINAKRSVNLQLIEEGEDTTQYIDVGSCTIPPNFDVPKEKDLVEIRYLYAYRGGSLYQPVYLGERDDIDEEDCTLDQLKYKAEELV